MKEATISSGIHEPAAGIQVPPWAARTASTEAGAREPRNGNHTPQLLRTAMNLANLLKKPHPVKGSMRLLLQLLLLGPFLGPVAATAQSAIDLNPAETALAGATTTRDENLWYARSNPGALRGNAQEIRASYAPSSLGIEGYYEGSSIARAYAGSWFRIALKASALGVQGYREMSGGAIISLDLPGEVTLGAAVALHSIHIDRYGSASAGTFDLGALARLTERIRFGASMRNPGRARLAGTELPQEVAFGFGFDVGAATTLSLDARHELRRPATVALGLSTIPVPELTVRAGVANAPATIGLGAEYQLDGITVEYGGAYISPLGFRHVIGAGIRW